MFAFSCRPKTDAHFRRVATLHDNTADRQAETCNTHSHDWPRLRLTSLESHNSGTSGNWVWARARVPGQTAATRATNVIDQKCNAWLPRNRTTAIPEWFFEVDQGSSSGLFDTLLQGNRRESNTWHSKSPIPCLTAVYPPATTPIHSLAHLFFCFFSAYAYLWLWPFGFAGLCAMNHPPSLYPKYSPVSPKNKASQPRLFATIVGWSSPLAAVELARRDW